MNITVVLIIFQVIILCATSCVFGYLLGKGKIEIVKQLTEEERAVFEKSVEDQKNAIASYESMVSQIMNMSNGGGDY